MVFYVTLPLESAHRKEPFTMQAKEELTSLADRNADTTNSDARYLGYAARLRTAVRAAHRYLAYSSDVGEAFRPVVPRWVVRTAYGVSWAHFRGERAQKDFLNVELTDDSNLSRDVSFETWKAKRRGPNPLEAATLTEHQRLALAAVKRGTFQVVASMAFPALTIHTLVRYSGRAMSRIPRLSPRTRAWGPTCIGLAAVPFLPYIFDKPIEEATDAAAEWLEHRWLEHQAGKKRVKKEIKVE
ncbi:hypothetical protein A7U60_g8586 [Sanghuangporus baumii]|uniref:Mitochondrial fission process protein 1 n=1 Tax=Sanghuangporus baumii TaxID=108892 RepID=A0A9Q5HRM3_SANBA|nr:hypothetical protein A7U60_g8586 [Sanghuangporus baumii]